MNSTIELLRVWRGKPVGTIDRQMGYGVHDTLVRRGIARFISEPIATVETESQPIRERKPRHRTFVKES